ncbi:MAG: phosphate ABC transporter permease subunit PstC [Pseudomonadota bacterium]
MNKAEAMLALTLMAIAGISVIAFVVARSRAVASAGGNLAGMHSRPGYHGLYAWLCVLMTGYGAYIVVNIISSFVVGNQMNSAIAELAPDLEGLQAATALNDARALALGGVASKTDALREELARIFTGINATRIWALTIVSLGAATGAAVWAIAKVREGFRARNRSEKILRTMLWIAASIAIITTFGIFLSLIGETLNFFSKIDWRIDKFLFGLTWSPLAGVHVGEMSADKVGAVPLFLGTAMITLIAMIVAIPVGLFAAIYLSEFASAKTRSTIKPVLEILAGIPTVVYGFFAATTVAPFMVGIGDALGIPVEAESALAAGVVMGIMIIPFISSLSDDVINAVPQALRDGSYGLGATKAETITKVVLPAALPGIVSASLLGVSRAVGETMIVVMAVGQSANLTLNPLDKVTTVTVQITMLILGDTEAETAAGPAYALGFALFVATLALNIFALRVVRKHAQKYD